MSKNGTKKEVWDHFYALIISGIIIENEIRSETLKKLLGKWSEENLYHLITHLEHFFDSEPLESLLQISSVIIEEEYSQEEADQFRNRFPSPFS